MCVSAAVALRDDAFPSDRVWASLDGRLDAAGAHKMRWENLTLTNRISPTLRFSNQDMNILFLFKI